MGWSWEMTCRRGMRAGEKGGEGEGGGGGGGAGAGGGRATKADLLGVLVAEAELSDVDIRSSALSSSSSLAGPLWRLVDAL